MPKQFDQLREQLLRAGVAPRHVRRYLAELEDHLDELHRQGCSPAEALARLGATEDLARPMLERREFRSLVARAPWAVMLLGPIITMIGSIVALGLMVVGFAALYHWIAPWPGRIEPMPLQDFAHAVIAFTVFILPLMIGWGAAGLAIQQRLRPLWPLMGLALFAFISGTFGMAVKFPEAIGEPGELSFGFSWLSAGLQGLTTVVHSLDSMQIPVDISPLRWIANLALLIGPYLAWRFRDSAATRDGADIAGFENAA